MPKKAKNPEEIKAPETKAEAPEVKAEAPEGGTVTVSAEEFKAMQEQLAVLTKYMAGENRVKSAQDKKLEEENKLLELVNAANKNAMEKVKIHVEKGNLKGNKNAEVAINGVQFIIPKGQDEMVPRCVAEVLENAERQKNAAYAMQEEKSTEYEQAQIQGAFKGMSVAK